jgi:hypothetical protein
MVGKRKNRRTGVRLKNFPGPLRLLVNLNRKDALQRKGIEIVMFFTDSH